MFVSVIDLLSDEESVVSKNKQFIEPNGDSNGSDASLTSKNDTSDAVPLPFHLKPSDLQPIEDIVTQCEQSGATKLTLNQAITLDASYIDMFVFKNASPSTVKLTIGGELEICMMEDDSKIEVVLCRADILYCLVMFHPPFYALLVKVSDDFSDLAIRDFAQLNSNIKDFNAIAR